ncbi:hypothetical protein [Spiroplasma ixodetis]|uniref:Uncharacterized protein n=1 Tax=Spiroplasma ixodetis TaxID=2141 RepID=A0ABM8JQ14_9MOLU
MSNEKWYFENIDSVLPILENEPKFLKNDFPLIIAIKYSYINSIWFKGRSIKSNLIKFK